VLSVPALGKMLMSLSYAATMVAMDEVNLTQIAMTKDLETILLDLQRIHGTIIRLRGTTVEGLLHRDQTIVTMDLRLAVGTMMTTGVVDLLAMIATLLHLRLTIGLAILIHTTVAAMGELLHLQAILRTTVMTGVVDLLQIAMAGATAGLPHLQEGAGLLREGIATTTTECLLGRSRTLVDWSSEYS
jgi:hypothetical protein